MAIKGLSPKKQPRRSTVGKRDTNHRFSSADIVVRIRNKTQWRGEIQRFFSLPDRPAETRGLKQEGGQCAIRCHVISDLDRPEDVKALDWRCREENESHKKKGVSLWDFFYVGINLASFSLKIVSYLYPNHRWQLGSS